MIPAAGLLLAAAVLTVLAGAVPAPALLPPALGLVLVTVGAWTVTAIAVRRMAITRSVAVREAREDEVIHLRFHVTGLGRLPVTLDVQTALGGWQPLTARGESAELVVGRRGPHLLGPSPVRARDALGIFERRSSAGRTESLLILPAPDHRFASSAAARAPADVNEPDGLRPYTPGTPLSRIHWPALARGAGMQARRLAPASEGLPLVVVDTDGDPGRDALDWTARAAAGCILQLVRAGGCRVLLPGDGTVTTVTGDAEWRAVHRRLAVLQRCPSAVLPAAPGGTLLIAAAAVAARTLLPPTDLPPGVEPTGCAP